MTGQAKRAKITVEVRGSWWRGYWVVILTDGREAGSNGPHRSKRLAEETAQLNRELYR